MMKLRIDDEIELRQVTREDASDIFSTLDEQREYLGQWLPFVALSEKTTDTEQFIQSRVNRTEGEETFTFTIRKNGVFIGMIELKDRDIRNKKAAIGYWLSKNYQQQGIMTKCVRKLCEFAFNELRLNRLQIKCAVKNERSRKIPQRLGFKLEGVERQGELLAGNTYADMEIYSLLRNEA